MTYLWIALGVLLFIAGALLLKKKPVPPPEPGPAARAPRPAPDPRETQLENSAQAVRGILLKLADIIHNAGSAAGSSNLGLAAAREQISRLALDEELKQAQDYLVSEIDRVISSNNALSSELSKAESALEEQRRQIDTLRTAVRIDALTQIANRAHFDERLPEEFDRLRRYGEPFSLILIDIDHFKNINDSYGHQTGDNLLQSLAKIFKATLRSSDFVARYGGEEFAMIVVKSGEAMARGVAGELRRTVESTAFKARDGSRIAVTISAGVAEARADDAPAGLIQRADEALYAAKRGGRNRVSSAGELAAGAGKQA